MSDQQLGDRLRRALDLEPPPATSAADIRERAARRHADIEAVGDPPPSAEDRARGYHLDPVAGAAPDQLEASTVSEGEASAAAVTADTPVWRKSAMSHANGCVEVAFANEAVTVRNSAKLTEPVLVFTHQEWAAFLRGVHDGEFDADAGDWHARKELAGLLREQGNLDELRHRADAGDWHAAGQLAQLLREQGNLDEATVLLRRAADAGDWDARRELAQLLREQGDVDELRRRADAGDSETRAELA